MSNWESLAAEEIIPEIKKGKNQEVKRAVEGQWRALEKKKRGGRELDQEVEKM